MLLSHVDNLLMVYVSDDDNLHVLTVIMISVELLDLIKSQVSQIIAVSSNGLSHHMISESVEMHVLEQSFLVLSVASLVDLVSLVLHALELFRQEGSVADNISEESQCL